MTTYYICRAEDVTDLELSQTDEEHLACEIVAAAQVDDEIADDLVAIEADSENGTYAQLKGVALFSVELNASNIEIWKTEGEKIYKYLVGPDVGNGRLWGAYGVLFAEIGRYEGMCDETNHFNELARGFADCIASEVSDNIRQEQSTFAAVIEKLYTVQKIKTVIS